jgi:serine O-acetyltransferase
MPASRDNSQQAAAPEELSPASLSNVDPLWQRVREEAEAARAQDPVLSQVLLTSILLQTRLEDAVIHRVASRLDHPDIPGSLLRQVFTQEVAADPDIASAIRADVVAIYERDPACHRFIEPILFFKGFHALTAYRFAHRLWHEGRTDFALFIQSRVSATFGVDIHPAARIGRGILVDHATGIVVGETAVDRRRSVDAAWRYAGRQRQGRWRPPSQGAPRRAAWGPGPRCSAISRSAIAAGSRRARWC